MNKKFKKAITTAILSVTATTALGCTTTNTKIAQKINKGVNDFVSSINKLDYVETNNTSNKSLGKIVSAVNDSQVFNAVTSGTNIENTITKPENRSDNFKLYTLSSTPFITLTSDNNNVNLSIEFSTEKIENTSDEISEKINKLILKRAILMVYVNEIYSGNVNLSDENRQAINAYVNVIKENASFLNGNRGMVKNQLNMASNLINSQSNDHIVNYYIIKSGEALEIRSNKIDSTISAIDSIISILETNLSPSSCYYQNNLTSSYESMLSSLNNSTTSNNNAQLAKDIAESINMLNTNTSSASKANTNSIPSTQSNTNNVQTINNTRTTNNNLNSNNNVSNNTISQRTRTNTITNSNNQRNNSTIDSQTHNSTINNQRSNTAIDTQTNNTTINSQRNNQSINRNYDNQIQTLEEYKNNTVDQQVTQNNNSDFSRPTPSQRTQTHRNRNNINNNYNPTMNPGSLNKTITSENENQITKRRESNRSSSDTENKHKATRVPYRMQSNYND